MSILKHFINKKREDAWGGGETSDKVASSARGNVALFYGVCRSIDDVAWWTSLTCEPDFSMLVTSCSTLIKKGAEGYADTSVLQVTSLVSSATMANTVIALYCANCVMRCAG
jgi:hypothetical protein